MLRSLQSAKTETPNDIMKHCIDLMNANLFFAASCILRLLHNSLSEEDKPKTATLMAQCGLALGSQELMNYAKQSNLSVQMRNVIGFVQEISLHKHMLERCSEECTALSIAPPTHDLCVAICAGGPNLMLQLWVNLHSLKNTGFSVNDATVVIVHADEISDQEIEKFTKEFSKFMSLRFLNIKDCTEFINMIDGGVDTLRGYQIKLAAMCVLNYKNIILCDADILWIENPLKSITRDCDLFIFSDIWHFKCKRHEKSSTTSFLYKLHNVDSDIQEFESGLVYINKESNTDFVRMLFHLCKNYKYYYFNLTFGDKDLYYMAAKKTGANVKVNSRLPMMLGNVLDGEFTSQSMVQLVENGPSHIHMTLHPISDDNVKVPTHLCEDSNHIHFVQRRINNKNVGTVACEVENSIELNPINIYSKTYTSAFSYARSFSL